MPSRSSPTPPPDVFGSVCSSWFRPFLRCESARPEESGQEGEKVSRVGRGVIVEIEVAREEIREGVEEVLGVHVAVAVDFRPAWTGALYECGNVAFVQPTVAVQV